MSIIEGTLLISETLILHLGLFAYNLIILNNALMNNVDSERLGYYLSEQTIEILEKLSYHLEHSMADHFASQVIDTLDHSYPVILLSYIVTFLSKFCLGCSNKHSCPHRIDFRRPTFSNYTPWSKVSGGPLPPVTEEAQLPPLYPGMFTVALREGQLPSLHPLFTSPWAVGFVFLTLQGSMGLKY